jgi:multiple antibiotic resistance protein
MLDTALSAFATFFVIIDPVGMVPLFIGLTPGLAPAARRATAFRSVGLAAIILLCFTVAGRPFLHYLGVSLAAFRIAGGSLLFLLAVDMVVVRNTGLRTTTPQEDAEAFRRADVTVFPLAIPLIAGPGAITSVILLQSSHAGDPVAQAVAAVVMIAVLALVLVGFLLAGPIMKLLGVTGVNVIGRVFGIVLAAIAVNNVVEGLRQSFPGLG